MTKLRHFREKTVTVPPQAHPLVKFVFTEMIRQQVTYCDLVDRAGVDRNTIRAWRTRNSPNLTNIEAVLNVLGYDIKPIRR